MAFTMKAAPRPWRIETGDSDGATYIVGADGRRVVGWLTLNPMDGNLILEAVNAYKDFVWRCQECGDEWTEDPGSDHPRHAGDCNGGKCATMCPIQCGPISKQQGAQP